LTIVHAAAALIESGQEYDEAEDEPLGNVEGLEGDELRSLNRPADWFGDGNGHDQLPGGEELLP
jgi:hypothetical protein